MSGVDILRHIYDTEKEDNYALLKKVIDWSILNFANSLIKCAHVLHYSVDKKDTDLFSQFPEEIRMLFDGKDKYIINGNYYEVYLKSAKNSYADIKVYGGKKESNNRFKWKIESVSEENAHFFIHNNHKATESDDYYLYLAVSTDKDGDQAAWVGLNNINHAPANETYQWDILCMINPDRIYFKFINREYHSKYLKLVENKDSYGDRKAMGSTFTDNINYKRNWWALVQA